MATSDWRQSGRGQSVAVNVSTETIVVQFISMGLIGKLLTRTYFENQGKVAHVVRATLNLDTAGRAT